MSKFLYGVYLHLLHMCHTLETCKITNKIWILIAPQCSKMEPWRCVPKEYSFGCLLLCCNYSIASPFMASWEVWLSFKMTIESCVIVHSWWFIWDWQNNKRSAKTVGCSSFESFEFSKGPWRFVQRKDALQMLRKLNFPLWYWNIPSNILGKLEMWWTNTVHIEAWDGFDANCREDKKRAKLFIINQPERKKLSHCCCTRATKEFHNLLNFMNDNKVTWQILMASSGKKISSRKPQKKKPLWCFYNLTWYVCMALASLWSLYNLDIAFAGHQFCQTSKLCHVSRIIVNLCTSIVINPKAEKITNSNAEI